MTITTEELGLETAATIEDLFDLDVRTLEIADPCGLINLTDDGCSSTCGACTTGAA
ncbi:hypothetical protein GCM10022252_19840 [Streptosporangium oxazolinicum]|uniref:FxLD family lantipeptide n=1 Tax=Streptosporangium oxazolinicum TaxID=909287 RepID=A0ABP8ANS9_9ACTN